MEDPALVPTDDELDHGASGMSDDAGDMSDDAGDMSDDAGDDLGDLGDDAGLDRMFCQVCKQYYVLDPLRERHDCAKLAAEAEDFLLMYECEACKEVFTPLSNLGMHQCRCHPGKYDPDTGWSCCGQRDQQITGRYVHNMVWQRHGRVEPLPLRFMDRRAVYFAHGKPIKIPPDGCTPCDHRHSRLTSLTNAIAAPVRVRQQIPEQVLGHFKPAVNERPGFRQDGKVYGRGFSPAELRQQANA